MSVIRPTQADMSPRASGNNTIVGLYTTETEGHPHRTGVTGRSAGEAGGLHDRLVELRARTSLPIAVGFGISNPDEARRLRGRADAVVVGAAFMRAIAVDPAHGAIDRAEELAQAMFAALAS